MLEYYLINPILLFAYHLMSLTYVGLVISGCSYLLLVHTYTRDMIKKSILVSYEKFIKNYIPDNYFNLFKTYLYEICKLYVLHFEQNNIKLIDNSSESSSDGYDSSSEKSYCQCEGGCTDNTIVSETL